MATKRIESLEESTEMTQDLRVLAVTSCGGFFLQGEPQEIAYRESLSEACVLLDVLVFMSWVGGD